MYHLPEHMLHLLERLTDSRLELRSYLLEGLRTPPAETREPIGIYDVTPGVHAESFIDVSTLYVLQLLHYTSSQTKNETYQIDHRFQGLLNLPLEFPVVAPCCHRVGHGLLVPFAQPRDLFEDSVGVGELVFRETPTRHFKTLARQSVVLLRRHF